MNSAETPHAENADVLENFPAPDYVVCEGIQCIMLRQ